MGRYNCPTAALGQFRRAMRWLFGGTDKQCAVQQAECDTHLSQVMGAT
jgi:hypothetical protein